MRNIFFFSAFLLSVSILKSQNFIPMAIEGAHWVIFSINDNGANHHVFHIAGDTTINNRDYKKCYRTPIKNDVIDIHDFAPPFYFAETRLIGAMRDDVDERSVYYYPIENIYPPYDDFPFGSDTCEVLNEMLVYNFALQPGNELEGCFHFDPNTSQIVDSVYYGFRYGNDRKHLFGGSFLTPLIEGIGADLGPFWNVSFAPYPSSPASLYDYCIGTDEDCELVFTSDTEPVNHWNTSVYPNPFSKRLTIDFSEEMAFPLEFSIHNAIGVLYHEETIFEKQRQVELNMSSYPFGAYVLVFKNKNGVDAKRLIKTD